MCYKTCSNCKTVYNGNLHTECPICDNSEFDFDSDAERTERETREFSRVSVVIDYEKQQFILEQS